MQTINLVNQDGSIWETTYIPDRIANGMKKLAAHRKMPVERLYLKAIEEGLAKRGYKGGRK